MLRIDFEENHKDQTYNTWYMPTFFTCKLQNAESDLTTISIYFDADRYGEDIEMCEKIFVPINEDNQHWYCTLVDFVEKKVYILDSLPNSTKQRGVVVRKLVQDLDTVLQHKFGDKYKFQASLFEVDESANIPKQPNGYDCGVYVINFMKSSEVEQMSSLMFQSETERFNIAMELVLHRKNAWGFLLQDHLQRR
ncbi:ubiquitin-like-specific protease ESD4 [Coffea eugenioides]|uniref:ubiquitin-like-specific protease ESD4 n=1 Tax=Coffea eugenioides TaxID=49369 RepID=UPI000F611A52|nr:ubiquitin-like-specific protease ESD4 [Coffea eugenioides]